MRLFKLASCMLIFCLLILVIILRTGNFPLKDHPEKLQEKRTHQNTIPETVWTPVDPGGNGFLVCDYIHPKTGHLFFSSDMDCSFLRSTDQGETWQPIANPIPGTVYGVAGDPNEPYTLYINQIGVTPRSSGIWKTTDNGDTWVQICETEEFGRETQSGVVDPHNTKVIYWTAADMGVRQSKDGGYSWVDISNGLPTEKIKRAYLTHCLELDHTSPSARRRIYYPTNLGLYYMKESECNWKLVSGLPQGNCTDVEVCDSGIIYVAFFDRGLFRSRDSGKTWKRLENGLDDKMPYHVAVINSRPDIVYVTTQKEGGEHCYDISQGVYGSQDGGDSFRLLTHTHYNAQYNWTRNYRNLEAHRSWRLLVDPNDPFTVYLEYDKKTHNGGQTWHNFGMKEFRRDRWKGTGLSLLTDYRVVFDPNRPNLVWLGFSDTGLMLSEDSGETIINILEFHRGEINQAAYWRDKLVYTSGSCQSIAVDPDLSTTIYASISAKEADSRFNAGGFVFKTVDGGWNWTPIYEKHGLDDGIVRSIIIDPLSHVHNRTIYVASYGNGVYKSVDDGRSFERITPPELFNGNTRLMWMEMAPSDPKTLYLAVGGSHGIRPISSGTPSRTMKHYPPLKEGQYGGVFKTNDGGKTWTKCNNAREIPSVVDISVHPFNAEIAYAAAFSEEKLVPEDSKHPEWRDGGVFRTLDGGKNWEKIFTPPEDEWRGKGEVQGICVNQISPEIIYAAVKNYGIYRTLDGGKAWQMVGKASMDRIQRTYHSIDLNPHDPSEVWVALFGNSFAKGIDYEARELMKKRFIKANFVQNPSFEDLDEAGNAKHWKIDQPPPPNGEKPVFSVSSHHSKDGKYSARFHLTKSYFDTPCPWPAYREQLRLEKEGKLPESTRSWWPCGLTNTWVYQKINPYFTSLMRGRRVAVEMDVFIVEYPKTFRNAWRYEEVPGSAPQVYLSEARDYNIHYMVAETWLEDAVPIDKKPPSEMKGQWIHCRAIGRVSDDANWLRVTISGVGFYSDPMDIYVDNVSVRILSN